MKPFRERDFIFEGTPQVQGNFEFTVKLHTSVIDVHIDGGFDGACIEKNIKKSHSILVVDY